MAARRRWASVFSVSGLEPMLDPHGASAMARVAGIEFCSSILPWRSCGDQDPWMGTSTAERTVIALKSIEAAAPTVWAGDWNHALSGREHAGSMAGRAELLAAVERIGLQVPTAALPHRKAGLLSIDHIAVPNTWRVRGAERFVATIEGRQISDHDAYVVEVVVPSSANRLTAAGARDMIPAEPRRRPETPAGFAVPR